MGRKSPGAPAAFFLISHFSEALLKRLIYGEMLQSLDVELPPDSHVGLRGERGDNKVSKIEKKKKTGKGMEEWQQARSFHVLTPARTASVPLQLNEVFGVTVSSAPLKNRSEASRVPRQTLTFSRNPPYFEMKRYTKDICLWAASLSCSCCSLAVGISLPTVGWEAFIWGQVRWCVLLMVGKKNNAINPCYTNIYLHVQH